MNTRTMALHLLAVLLLTMTLAACGDTWSGIRQDTSENLEATGQAIEGAGEAAEPDEEE